VSDFKNPWGWVRGGIGRATSRTRERFAKSREAIGDRVGGATETPRARASSLRQSARERPTTAVAIVGGVLLGIAWIAWAIYVTTENGANAGLGVLITWPVLIGALALIAAPFVLAGMLVKRFRPDGGDNPPIAGAANGDETAD
jgi:hypothetical protein